MHKSVTAVEVVDVEKRRLPSKHYVYVIKVTWDDGSSIKIYRRYSNFFDLQTSLLETFPEEGGQLNPDERTIPFLPGKKYFGRSHIREVAEKRLGPIDKYCKLLIKLDKKISQCHEVLTFFEPTADDLSPKSKDYRIFSLGKMHSALDIFPHILNRFPKSTFPHWLNLQMPHFTSLKKPGEAKISKPKLLEQYEAIFDYQKQAKDQVDLKVGQNVQVIEKYETGWWLVNTEYEEGYAPGTFLQKTDGQEEEQMFTCNGEKYICTQSYTAEAPDDHTLNIGAVVEVLQKSLDGWWWVRYKGKIGWAPATCLKVANSLSHQSANIPVEIVSNLSDVSKLLKGNDTTSDSPMSVSQRPNSVAETYTDLPYVSVQEGDNYEEDEESHYSQLSSIYGNTSHTVLPPPRQKSIKKSLVPMNSEEKKTKFITCAEYIDSIGDGISFSAGQEVEVQQKTDSGWYYIKLGNEFGWAPSSYLEEIPLDETDSNVGFDEVQEEQAEEVDDDDDDDEYETINLCPAKQIENMLVSKLTPAHSPSNSQSDGLELSNSSSDDLKPPLSSSPTGSSSSTNSSLSRRTAVKRPNSIPPAPPKRPDHPGGQPPLPSVPPISSATKINSQLPPPPPPPPSSVPKKPVPPSSTGLYKSSKTSATSPPQPPPPPPGKPHSGKSHPLVANSIPDHSKDTSNNSGNLATELQSRLAKLKANFDSGSSASNKKQQPLTKEKPVIIHGVNIKGGATSVTGSKVTETKDIKKSQPQVLLPHVQKTTPILPTPPCNVENSLAQPQKDDIQRIPVPNVGDSSVVVPSTKFAERLSVFQMNTNGDNAAAIPKYSNPNVPLASNCRGLALLQRQKDKFMEEAESNCKASNESLEPETKVSNLRNNFESSPCKLSPSSVVSPDQPTNMKPAPPTKPIHKVKPTTAPAKTNPNLPVKPKVSPCKPKFGSVTNPGKKDSTTNIANKINKFGGNNLASPAKISATEMEPSKFQLIKEKVMTPTNQTQQNTAKEMKKSTTDFNINSVIRAPKSTERTYKACSIYIAESEGEVSFEKGVDIEVLEKHESGWWLVKVGGEEGWAPSNHIFEVKPLPSTKPLPPNKPLPKLPSSPSIKSTSQNTKPEISNNTTSLSENNNKNESNNNNKELNPNENTLAPNNNLGNEGQFVTLSDFNAFEEDEISIEAGMYVKILDSSSTDRWHVMLQSGEDGWIPANCIGTIHDV